MNRSPVLRVGVGVVAGLGLAMVFLLGPDLFQAIPWAFRWWLGEFAFVGLIVGIGFWTYRVNPPRPWLPLDPNTTPRLGLHRVLALALQLVTVSFAYPLFARPGYSGVFDWDWDLAWFDAIRQSILRYHEFPWWHARNSGGFPLAAEPQVGLLSPITALVLPFGASTGLRLSVVLALMLGVEGARRLARLWLTDPWAVALASMVYGWNGFILVFTVVAPPLTFCHPFLPWLLLYGFQVDRSAGMAAKLGAVAALSVLTVIQYPTAYGFLIAGVVLAWGGLGRARGERPRYLASLGLAAGIFLTMAGWRLAMTGQLMGDFPRRYRGAVNSSPWLTLHGMLDRLVPTPPQFPSELIWLHEQAGYVGWVPVLAAVASLAGRWRWWHTLAFVGFALAMGSVASTHPSYWLAQWPVFATMHQVGRWRFPALLGVGLAAGSTLQIVGSAGRWGRWVSASLALVVLIDLAVYAQQSLPVAYSNRPIDQHSPGPPVPTIVSLRRWESGGVPEDYQATKRGYGVIEGYCPLLGYDRQRPTARLWRDHPDYRGEFVTNGGPITPSSWSPGRITFYGLESGQEIEINQNPSCYWLANGRRLFPDARCVELTRRFVARADVRGTLILEARPPSRVFWAAGLSTALGLALAVASFLALRRFRPGSA